MICYYIKVVFDFNKFHNLIDVNRWRSSCQIFRKFIL